MSDTQGALSGVGIARNLAYGDDDPQSGGGIAGALSQLMDPERAAQTEKQAFWAGMTAPNNGTGGASTSNALAAQNEARLNNDKLKAQYIPMIMQSLAAQRTNQIAYAKMMMERQKEVNPIINSALYGLQANGAPVTMAQAHQTIDDVGAQYNMHPQELAVHHSMLDHAAGPDGKGLPNYLQQRRVAAAPAAEGLAGFGKNAAGQTVVENRVAGTVAAPMAGANTNPSTAGVKAGEAGQGDIKAFGEGLMGKIETYNQMMQRVNAVSKSLDEFEPGKYSGVAGGFAAAVTDLSKRFPSATMESIKGYVESKLGAKGGNPLAAKQFADSIRGQESLAQIKAMLTGADGNSAGRVNQAEFRVIDNLALGSLTDPTAFKRFQDFHQAQYSNAMRKYIDWTKHKDVTPPESLSVDKFNAPWEQEEQKRLSTGEYGDLGKPPAPKPAEQPKPAAPAPAPAAAARPTEAVKFEPSQWEKGAVMAPGGKRPVVKDPTVPGGYRYAKPGGRAAQGNVTDGQAVSGSGVTPAGDIVYGD